MMLKKVYLQRKAQFFTSSISISILGFFTIIKFAWYTYHINEGEAMWVLRFVVKCVFVRD